MTYLGRGGPLPRLASAVRGWMRPPPPGRAEEVLVVGHRGAPREEAENTLASFQRALERGADAVEADVCVTRDGRFVMWHDADPDGKVAIARQLGAERLLYRPAVPELASPWRRPVRELDWEAFRERHSYVLTDGGGSRRPVDTLEDLLEWSESSSARTAGLRHVFVDIKLEPAQTESATALARLLEAEARAGAMEVEFHLLSPHAEIVAALVAANTPSLRITADFELPGAAEIGPGTGASDLSLGAGGRITSGFLWNLDRSVRARRRGLVRSVTAWTINSPRLLAKVLVTGADAILTDDAPLLRAMVGVSRRAPEPGPRRVPTAPSETRERLRAGRRGPC